MSRLSILLACCLLFFSSPADASDAGDHNSTRSNSGTVAGSKEKPNGAIIMHDSRSNSGTVSGGGNASDQLLLMHQAACAFCYAGCPLCTPELFEYELIAALMGDSDSEAIEYGLIAALIGDTADNQPVDLDDKRVRKKPNRVGDGVDLDSTEMVNPSRADSTATSGRNGPGDLHFSFTIRPNYVEFHRP